MSTSRLITSLAINRLSTTLVLAIGFGVLSTGVAQGQTKPPQQKIFPKINLTVGYQVDPNWPSQTLPSAWELVTSVAVDAKDRVWAVVHGDKPIQIFSADGKCLGAWERGELKRPHHMRIDGEGNVWVADVERHVVCKFSPTGKELLILGTPDEPGEDEIHLNKPTDMAITPAGDVFVSDGYGNNRIVHFDANGRFVKCWGKQGVEAGQLYLPHSIVVDSKGLLYVTERNNGRIQVFDQTGKSLALWCNLMVPWSLWITPKDEIYVCGSSPMRWGPGEYLGVPPKDHMVMKIDTQGRVQQVWTFPLGQNGLEKPGELNFVHGIAVDSRGDLYLGDVYGKRVQKFIRLPADR